MCVAWQPQPGAARRCGCAVLLRVLGTSELDGSGEACASQGVRRQTFLSRCGGAAARRGVVARVARQPGLQPLVVLERERACGCWIFCALRRAHVVRVRVEAWSRMGTEVVRGLGRHFFSPCRHGGRQGLVVHAASNDLTFCRRLMDLVASARCSWLLQHGASSNASWLDGGARWASS